MKSGEFYTVVHDQTRNVGGCRVVANDTGSPGDTPTMAGAGGTPEATVNGTVTLNADGSFQYTPTPGYVGADTFTCRDADGSLVSQPATVTINVTDQAPQANSNYGNTVNSNGDAFESRLNDRGI